jgi:uncharacterized phage infection (PIP) family protein YhgE
MDYASWIAFALAGCAIVGFLAMTKRHAELLSMVRAMKRGHEHTTDLAAMALKRAGRTPGVTEVPAMDAADPLPKVVTAMRSETFSMANRSSALNETDTSGNQTLELASLRRQLREEIAESDDRARKAFNALTAQLTAIAERMDRIAEQQDGAARDNGRTYSDHVKRHDENVTATKGAFEVVQQAILALQSRVDTAEKISAAAQQLNDKIETAHQAVATNTDAVVELRKRLEAAEGNISVAQQHLSNAASADRLQQLSGVVTKNSAEIVRLAERVNTAHSGLTAMAASYNQVDEWIADANSKLANIDRVYEAADLVNRALPAVQEGAERAMQAAEAAQRAANTLSGATGAWEAKLQAVADKATGADAAAVALSRNIAAHAQRSDRELEAIGKKVDDVSKVLGSRITESSRVVEQLSSYVRGLEGRGAEAIASVESKAQSAISRLDSLPAAAELPNLDALHAAVERVNAADALLTNNAEVLGRLVRSVSDQSQQIGGLILTSAQHTNDITDLDAGLVAATTALGHADAQTRQELGAAVDKLTGVVTDSVMQLKQLRQSVANGITDKRVDALLAERAAARHRVVSTGAVPPAPPSDKPNPNHP